MGVPALIVALVFWDPTLKSLYTTYCPTVFGWVALSTFCPTIQLYIDNSYSSSKQWVNWVVTTAIATYNFGVATYNLAVLIYTEISKFITYLISISRV